MIGPRTLLRELRRRKVFRVTVIYAGVTLAVLQGADVVVDALRLPDWVLTAIVAIGVAGFPVAVVLSYLLDITPQGLETAESAEGDGEYSRAAAVGVAGLGFGLALVTVWWIFAVGRSPEGGENEASIGVQAGSEAEPSLVILPFDVRAAQGEEASFFAEGLYDELLTELGAVAGLRVLSRGSAAAYTEGDDARTVGRELGASALLQGRIRQIAGQVQVTVELVDTRSAEQLWAGNYRRGVTVQDIFALQGEVAREIAGALRSTLSRSDAPMTAAEQTEDEEAYQFYLRANRHAANATFREDALAAVSLYEQALRRDSTFFAAASGLARLEGMVFGLFDPTPQRLERALQAYERTVTLEPTASETRLAEGYIEFFVRQDFTRANEIFSRLRSEQPNNAELHWVQGRLFRRLGEVDSARVSYGRALELDPRSARYHLEVGSMHYVQDRFDEAERYFNRAVAEAPSWLPAYLGLATIYTRIPGRPQDIAEVLERAADQVGMQTVVGTVASLQMRTLMPYMGHMLLDSLAAIEPDSEHIDPISYHAAKAQLYRDRGDSAVARAHSDSLVAILEPLAEERPSEGRFQVELAYGYAGQNRKAEAIAAVEQALLLAPDARDVATSGVWTLDLVLVLLMVGELDTAMDRLATLYGRYYSPNAYAFEAHPWLAPLHDHPRFLELMEDWDDARRRASPVP